MAKLIKLTILFVLTGAFAVGQTREVALTFDDLPASQRGDTFVFQKYVTDKLLERLKAEKVPAIGFVNESRIVCYGEIDKRTELLKQWLDAGFELGNHTFSHVAIDAVSFDAYVADLIRGETITTMLLEQKRIKAKVLPSYAASDRPNGRVSPKTRQVPKRSRLYCCSGNDRQ